MQKRKRLIELCREKMPVARMSRMKMVCVFRVTAFVKVSVRSRIITVSKITDRKRSWYKGKLNVVQAASDAPRRTMLTRH